VLIMQRQIASKERKCWERETWRTGVLMVSIETKHCSSTVSFSLPQRDISLSNSVKQFPCLSPSGARIVYCKRALSTVTAPV